MNRVSRSHSQRAPSGCKAWARPLLPLRRVTIPEHLSMDRPQGPLFLVTLGTWGRGRRADPDEHLSITCIDRQDPRPGLGAREGQACLHTAPRASLLRAKGLETTQSSQLSLMSVRRKATHSQQWC